MHELRELLLANLDGAYRKHGWHGTTLRAALRGVSAEGVVWRPRAGRHNIWELTAHAAYWKYVARRRLRGAERFPLKGSNFFASPATVDEHGWRELVDLLEEQHRLLVEAVASLSDAELREPKKQRLVYGVAAHDVYHTGQIQLLKALRRE